MRNVARPWMLVYAILYGLLSVLFVANNFWNHYYIAFIIWSGIYYALVFAGNLIFSLDAVTPKVRKVWRLVFPIIVGGYIFSVYTDLTHGRHVQNAPTDIIAIVFCISLVLRLPTFWAHYKIGYGRKSDKLA
jgi:hypothetical protein